MKNFYEKLLYIKLVICILMGFSDDDIYLDYKSQGIIRFYLKYGVGIKSLQKII